MALPDRCAYAKRADPVHDDVRMLLQGPGGRMRHAAVVLSALVFMAGAFSFLHQGLTGELIILGAIGVFLVGVPLLARTERRT